MRITIPKNTWVNIKQAASLEDDKAYTTSNEGISILQVTTDQDNSTAPTQDPRTIGVRQDNRGSRWLDHSSKNGKGIWVYSYDIDGELEVQI